MKQKTVWTALAAVALVVAILVPAFAAGAGCCEKQSSYCKPASSCCK